MLNTEIFTLQFIEEIDHLPSPLLISDILHTHTHTLGVYIYPPS